MPSKCSNTGKAYQDDIEVVCVYIYISRWFRPIIMKTYLIIEKHLCAPQRSHLVGSILWFGVFFLWKSYV